ncbi:MBL fold metallo-hydrolase [Peredibacter sp. HCB2-198]|uniref:MBL fold metallo-hydrolase n=1 Tax=Peredibacter sp. HCB2-198 TaxID=3383025 RepID=UPI0038B5DAF5
MIQYLLAVLLLLVPLLGECMPSQKPTNYSIEAGEFMNLPAKDNKVNKMGFLETLSIMKKVFLEKSTRAPKTKLPEVKPDMNEFLKPSDFVKFVWFGHSTLLLNLDGKIILIDPVFGKSASPFDFLVTRFQPPVLKLEELPKIDAILISHDHYDHLDKSTVKYFADKNVEFIVPIGVGDHLLEWEVRPVNIVELNWGESISQGGIKFTAAPARHFSGRGLFDRNKTLWASWVIQGKHDKIFYSGDSGYGDHFKEIGKRFGPFDLAFIENGQYNERWPDVHMQPEESLQAMIDVDAKALVPVHWGMFDLSLHHWTEPIHRTYQIAKAWDIPIFTPKLGEIVDTGRPHENKPWWEPLPTINQAQDQKLGMKLVPELAK